jgi:cell division protein FtsZ
MQDMVQFETDFNTAAKIKVAGVGGGGTNAVDSMVESGLRGVEFYVVNTDAQALGRSKVPTKIQIGRDLTNGRGAGADPAIGSKAALDAKDNITEALKGADMVFITAGLGGGTGTGAAPVIAEIAKSMGILTVAVVTRPFRFEGPQRMKNAGEGLERLREFVDTCIVVSNDRLLEVVGAKATLKEAFQAANNVLTMAVSSISDLISTPGLINVDFADIRTIMNQTGGAVMGVGIGKGENRATEAVKKACASPLLDKIVIDGARGVLICVTGGADMTLYEINEATTMVYEAASPEANIIFGAVIDDRLKDEVRVTIIATGFEEKAMRGSDPKFGRDDMKVGSGSTSLKDKLESLFPGSSRSSSSARKESPVAKPVEPEKPRKETPAAAEPAVPSPLFAEEVPAASANQDEDTLDFNRPDNPLRSPSSRPAEKSDESDRRPAEPEKPATPAPGPEDPYETPAYILRRKNLFE